MFSINYKIIIVYLVNGNYFALFKITYEHCNIQVTELYM
jgi:hypothetical protein